MTPTPTTSKLGYHHGNLKAALITAADEIIRDKGIEGFSLREAARRAGVSIGAPAHHFGSATGLLTEVALLGYDSLGVALNAIQPSLDALADLRQLALAYVEFALAHPGRFRLMFRPDLVDRNDPRYGAVSAQALSGFVTVIRRQNPGSTDPMAEVFIQWSTVHGMANLVLDGKAKYLFDCATPQDFVTKILPTVLANTAPFSAS